MKLLNCIPSRNFFDLIHPAANLSEQCGTRPIWSVKYLYGSSPESALIVAIAMFFQSTISAFFGYSRDKYLRRGEIPRAMKAARMSIWRNLLTIGEDRKHTIVFCATLWFVVCNVTQEIPQFLLFEKSDCFHNYIKHCCTLNISDAYRRMKESEIRYGIPVT
ncbi:hypothetical protein [Undibacterium sp. Tian12W]|uniref:hypothetical protein n=1 Tax=Undibacterium sp. Tian12W TaxID=3413054 RepID=UPI003BF581D5